MKSGLNPLTDAQDMGGISGSCEPSPLVSALTGFDPGRALARVSAAGIAWDEAASCLSRRDCDGFDSAMRVFRKLTEGSGASVNGAPANQ